MCLEGVAVVHDLVGLGLLLLRLRDMVVTQHDLNPARVQERATSRKHGAVGWGGGGSGMATYNAKRRRL